MNKTDDEFAAVLEDDGWNTDEKCPWCKASIDDLHDYVNDDGGDYEFPCPHCDQPICGSEWRQYVLQKPRRRS